MNEDAFQILDCLPYLYKSLQDEEYINFLWETFCANYEKKISIRIYCLPYAFHEFCVFFNMEDKN